VPSVTDGESVQAAFHANVCNLRYSGHSTGL